MIDSSQHNRQIIQISNSQNDMVASDDDLAEMATNLQSIGFPTLANSLKGWHNLARIIQIDPAGLSVEEIYDEALVWAERQRVIERIRQSVLSSRKPVKSKKESEQGHPRFGFPGHNDWVNWGLGLDDQNLWHLFHFNREKGASWRPHSHVAVKIPQGICHELAQEFVYGKGILTVQRAYAVWRKHAIQPVAYDETEQALKPALTKLRNAIRKVIRSEGHSPHGNPIPKVSSEKCWRAVMRFGYRLKDDKSRIRFQYQS